MVRIIPTCIFVVVCVIGTAILVKTMMLNPKPSAGGGKHHVDKRATYGQRAYYVRERGDEFSPLIGADDSWLSHDETDSAINQQPDDDDSLENRLQYDDYQYADGKHRLQYDDYQYADGKQARLEGQAVTEGTIEKNLDAGSSKKAALTGAIAKLDEDNEATINLDEPAATSATAALDTAYAALTEDKAHGDGGFSRRARSVDDVSALRRGGGGRRRGGSSRGRGGSSSGRGGSTGAGGAGGAGGDDSCPACQTCGLGGEPSPGASTLGGTSGGGRRSSRRNSRRRG